MSQGIGRSEVSETGGGLVSGRVRRHTAFVKFAPFHGHGTRHSETITIGMSNIIDHKSP